MNVLYEKSIEYAEEQNTKKIWPDIEGHINYLTKIYNLCFEAQKQMEGKSLKDISHPLRAQHMILADLTDFIRSIQFLIIEGYPKQACTLATSIFELAHTALYFQHKPQEATKWLEATSIKHEMPKFMECKKWDMMVRENCKFLGINNPENEYRIYKQLCWLKHSLPFMQDMLIINKDAYFNIGPHCSERSISHAWFAMEHAGRLTILVMYKCLQMQVDEVAQIGAELNEKAIIRFRNNNPFDESHNT